MWTTVIYEVIKDKYNPKVTIEEKEVWLDRIPSVGEFIYFEGTYKVISITTKISGLYNNKNKIIINVTNNY